MKPITLREPEKSVQRLSIYIIILADRLNRTQVQLDPPDNVADQITTQVLDVRATSRCLTGARWSCGEG